MSKHSSLPVSGEGDSRDIALWLSGCPVGLRPRRPASHLLMVPFIGFSPFPVLSPRPYSSLPRLPPPGEATLAPTVLLLPPPIDLFMRLSSWQLFMVPTLLAPCEMRETQPCPPEPVNVYRWTQAPGGHG